MEMPTEGAATWKVMDASGRIVRTGRSSVGEGMNQVEIDLAGVDQGSYVVELIGSEGTPLGTARFVRQ
ncbi:MAG: T9SS type A sorting domain-containing protein [Flavobacteriales bacterium]|nr:T9SS type A sorting domain-containing protein [Flavobacteriales bacterium]